MSKTVTISFLGTGSGIPSADRFFSSTLIHSNGNHLLVDVGEPCVHLLRDRGDLLQETGAVFITHGHVDHIGGVPALLQGCKLLGRTKPLPIYLPEEMIAPLRAWISALYLPEEGLGFPIRWNAWKNDAQESLEGGFLITPRRNAHLDSCYRGHPGSDPARRCDSYSLEIQSGDFRAIFSGDLASAGELTLLVSPKAALVDNQPITVLVSELSHFPASELASALQGADVETLCLVHLSGEYARNRSELRIQMEEMLPMIENVIVPEDGESLDF